MKAGDVVEAFWDDHTFVFNLYGGEGITKVTTCGYFVSEDEETLKVALCLSDGKPADVQVIDKRMLTKVRKVR